MFVRVDAFPQVTSDLGRGEGGAAEFLARLKSRRKVVEHARRCWKAPLEIFEGSLAARNSDVCRRRTATSG